MKKIYKNLVNGGFLGAAMLLGATACSDDHFDIKGQSGTEGSTTIWESIEANEELSDVAAVLKRARVMKDDKDNKSNLNYADWLNQPMEMTVWLPKNNTFDVQYYLKKLDYADSLRTQDSIAKSLRVHYQVVNQFVKNHMALFNYNATAAVQKVRLMNAKNCLFDAVNGTFNGVKIDKSSSVHTSNGTMYVLEGASPFANNIYDFMSSDPAYSTIYSILTDPSVDKNVFWPEGSLEGGMNENGEIVYVDSVFTNSNEYLNASGALIKSEDSLYIAMIPTNQAWDEAYAAVKPLMKYDKSYCYEWRDGKFNKTGNNALKFNVDSLTTRNTNRLLIQSMFFNTTDFHLPENADSAAYIQHLLYADSLISTNGVIFYNENAGTGKPNPLFAGMTPIKASNGYVFAMEENRIKPEYSFIGRREMSPNYMMASLDGCVTENGEFTTLTVENWQKDLVSGSVENDNYFYYKMNGNNTLKIRLKLEHMPSGHYKISAQMLPNRINRFNVRHENDGITPIKEKPQFDATIYGDDMKIMGKKSKNLTVNQDSVENVVLFEDFYMDKSYAALPSGYDSFAILEISMTAAQKRKGDCEALSIAKIIVEPVRK